MTQNEIALEVKKGNTAQMTALWLAYRNYIATMANKWKTAFSDHLPAADTEDLIQSGYFAILDALEYWDPDQAKFITVLTYFVKTAFAEALGLRTSKRDAAIYTESLSEPVTEDGSATLEDTIQDDSDPYESAEDDVYQEQLRTIVSKALDDLPEKQREIIRRRDLNGDTCQNIARDLQISKARVYQERQAALYELRQNTGVREAFYRDRNPYTAAGFQAWLNSGLSVQERYLFALEDAERRERRRRRQLKEYLKTGILPL